MSQNGNAATQGPPDGPENVGEFFVPYKNRYALAAYYLGIFSFIPVLGIFLGVPAFILGVMGYRRARRYPQARGKVHAWVGIIMGGLFGFGQLIVIIPALIMN